MTSCELLYATIMEFQLRERLRRHDYSFDAWAFFTRLLGFKSPSALYKMCERGSACRLGFEHALLVMHETDDYRLLHYARSWLRSEAEKRADAYEQVGLFDEHETNDRDDRQRMPKGFHSSR